MTCLVTGGLGFIGSRVVRLLSQDGEKVVAYDIDSAREGLEQVIDGETSSRIEVVQGDVTDLALLIRTVQKYKVERIIHLAACLSPAAEENPLLAVQVTCIGTLNILETARILSLERVVWASSGKVFGPPEKYEQEYISDDAPHYPLGIYGACKSFNEEAARHYFSKYGVDSIAIRFGKVYGVPWRVGGSVPIIEELVVKPVLGKPGKVPFGDALVNWLYVEDAAMAVVMASRAGATRTKAFNVNGDIRTMTEAVNCVKKLIPQAKITLLPGLPGSIGFAVKYDTARIKEEIGYQPQWTLEQGIKKVIDDIRQQHNL